MPSRSSLETDSIGGPAYRVASATGWSVPKSVPKLGPATIILQPTPTKSLIKRATLAGSYLLHELS
jgi:hypothetical protein